MREMVLVRYKKGGLQIRKAPITIAEGRCPWGMGMDTLRKLISAKTDDCIRWPYHLSPSGYGQVYTKTQGKMRKAHIVAWYIANNKPLPRTKKQNTKRTLNVCHTCDTPACINPRHLFRGNQQKNIDDMMTKDRNRQGETHHNAKLTTEQVIQIRNTPAGKQAQTLPDSLE